MIEIGREFFQSFLKEKSKDLTNLLAARNKKTSMLISTTKVTPAPTFQNIVRPQSIAKSRTTVVQTRMLTDQSRKKLTPDNFGEEGEQDKNVALMNNNSNLNDFPRGSPKSSDNKLVLAAVVKNSKNVTRDQPPK